MVIGVGESSLIGLKFSLAEYVGTLCVIASSEFN